MNHADLQQLCLSTSNGYVINTRAWVSFVEISSTSSPISTREAVCQCKRVVIVSLPGMNPTLEVNCSSWPAKMGGCHPLAPFPKLYEKEIR